MRPRPLVHATGSAHGSSSLLAVARDPEAAPGICNLYARRYRVTLDPETEAIVTIGCKEGLAHLAMAVVDHGDSVLVS